MSGFITFITLVFLVGFGLVAWVLADLNRFDRADFDAIGMSKGVVALVTLFGSTLGLLLYLAHYRPKLQAAHAVRDSMTGSGVAKAVSE